LINSVLFDSSGRHVVQLDHAVIVQQRRAVAVSQHALRPPYTNTDWLKLALITFTTAKIPYYDVNTTLNRPYVFTARCYAQRDDATVCRLSVCISHTRFRLVPKSMTLDGFQQPNRHSCRKKFYGVHQKNLNEDRPVL